MQLSNATHTNRLLDNSGSASGYNSSKIILVMVDIENVLKDLKK